jgi:DNA-binding transcriptional LysR family regulator
VIQAALAGGGRGLAYEEQVAEHIAKRRLIRVLEDWSPSFPGFYLFYPGRHHQPAVLCALVRTLRFP